MTAKVKTMAPKPNFQQIQAATAITTAKTKVYEEYMALRANRDFFT